MGVMQREIKKVKGRDSFLAIQEDLDNFVKAKGYQRTEDSNSEFLKQLYFGMDRILSIVDENSSKIEKLVNELGNTQQSPKIIPSRNVKVRIRNSQPAGYQELAKAFYLIESHRDHNGRITWRNVEDPKQLIFAYMRKAEAEGINIDKTMEVQDIPQYRRVFQYVVYNIGSWADIVAEYRASRPTAMVH
jgi:hypothetical protein